MEGIKQEFYRDDEETEQDATDSWDALTQFGVRVQEVP